MKNNWELHNVCQNLKKKQKFYANNKKCKKMQHNFCPICILILFKKNGIQSWNLQEK